MTDLPRAIAWGDQLSGEVETFAPNDVEHVWTLGEHVYVCAELLPEHARNSAVTLFLDGGEVPTHGVGDLRRRVRVHTARCVWPHGCRRIAYSGRELTAVLATVGP